MLISHSCKAKADGLHRPCRWEQAAANHVTDIIGIDAEWNFDEELARTWRRHEYL